MMHVVLVAFKYEGDPVTKLIKAPLQPFSDQEIRNLVVYFSLIVDVTKRKPLLATYFRARCTCTWSTLIFK